jgi:organic radical activating enzyme
MTTVIPLNNPRKELLDQTKAALDRVSPTFCTAKWQQVTIHLQNGLTHSCHHPRTHKIPLTELAVNPSALHNTIFKKEQRKLMLEGKRPAECDYCWRVEDTGRNSISDRTYKSAESWSRPFINEISNKPWDDDVLPSYVEVSFGHTCNFKCSYCMPVVSSKWMEEIEKHGAYPTSTQFNNLDWVKDGDMMPIPNREHNPYVEAFWKWWPELYPALHHFRITGGEPLLNKNTFKVMDWIIEHPRPDLEFSINSNMCVPAPLLKTFTEKVKRITGEGLVKQFKVFTSAEAHGERANYIRHGLDYNKWLDNIDKMLSECPSLAFTCMSTFNALSVTSYQPFLKDMLDLRIKHMWNGEVGRAPLLMDFPYLRHPNHQAAYILTGDFLEPLSDSVTWMYRHIVQPNWKKIGYSGFHEWECDKLRRVYDVVEDDMQKELDEDKRCRVERADFYKFFTEHDRRRGTDFCKTFPEMEGFYKYCKLIAEQDA